MKLFVAKLDYSTHEDTLREFFEGAGEVVSAKIIMDRETGRSRGFGFVEMASADEGRNAIETLDGSLLDGRNIVVKEAEDRQNNNRGRGGFNNNRGGGYNNNRGGGYNNNRGGGYDRGGY